MAEAPGSPLRLFIVGAGTMAREHAQAAYATGREIELHVADPDPSARERFASEFPKSNVDDSGNSMLAKATSKNDLVIVATPPWLHESYLELGLRSGRNVLCEKPLLTSRQAIDSVNKTLRQSGRTLFCCSCRFIANPATRAVADLVKNGELGQVYSVTLRQSMQRMRSGIEWQPESAWFMDESKNGGGCLMDWAPYDLANLNQVLKPDAITALQVELAQPELPSELPNEAIFDVESHANATLLYHCSDGSTVPVHYERGSGSFGPNRDEAVVTGTRGSVSWTIMGYAGDLELSLRNAENETGAVHFFQPPGELWYSRAPVTEALNFREGQPHMAVA
ncbi:MAG: Gfo/Idh/MocA family oxidoreductase, partial [Myxococcota bacterium]